MASRQFYGGIGDFIDVRLIMSEVSSQSEKQIAQGMSKFVKQLNRKIEESKVKDLERIHKQTARLAQDAILEAYRGSGIGLTPSYRYQDRGKLKRFSNGAMEKALKNSKLIESDATGIRFINQSVLDQLAPQWYRLNFGAAPRGSKNPPVGSMRFMRKASSQRVELTGFKPSKAFNVPSGGVSGMWSSTFAASSNVPLRTLAKGSGRGALYIKRRGMKITGPRGGRVSPTFFRNIESRGIQGKRFLDAGARSINIEYPKLLTAMVRSWEADAKKNLK